VVTIHREEAITFATAMVASKARRRLRVIAATATAAASIVVGGGPHTGVCCGHVELTV
jgi:hypothetical protein